MIKLSDRISRVEPSPTLAITAKAKAMKAEGIDIISFGAGEPDFDTPEPVREAAKASLDKGQTRYTAAAGIPELRAAIARDYARRGREVKANEVIVSSGGKHALYTATQVIFEAGDKVIVPGPYWVSYPAQILLADAEPVFIDCPADQDFKLTPEQLFEALKDPAVRGLILCSPSNPTGAVYTRSELEALGAVLASRPEVVTFYDAMYDELYYEGAIAPDLVACVPALKDSVVTFNGFSKTYAMTGWRLGYAIAPAGVAVAMDTLQSQSTSNSTSFVQYAALAAFALDPSVLTERREAFRRRKDLIVGLLRGIEGVKCTMPLGAFYAFADFSAYIDPTKSGANTFADDMQLTEFLLVEAKVAVVPGSSFGAPGFLRLSYATSDALIEEGVRRIKRALKG
ncbi:MAG: pyridoxal phosphate-dependent aminotransferase [Bradymonadaceae bacterium]|nr:pyridoxal phosphate-dependent aminotransferase [Lujinxingiaceae bacterium]